MGGNSSSESKETPEGEAVLLHVYDAVDPMSVFVYHTGLEVYGTEHTFAATQTLSTGIYSQRPLYMPPGSEWKFKETITLGLSQAPIIYPLSLSLSLTLLLCYS